MHGLIGGAPVPAANGVTAPTAVPLYVGQTYINTLTGAIYIASGTAGTYNWGYVGQGATSAFNKNTVAGLVGWYDAADATTITKGAGDAVTQWADKSDRAAHLATTPATKPVWTDATQNGLPAIYFGGATHIYQTGLTDQTSATPSSYIVIKPTNWSTGGTQKIIDCGNATPTSLFYLGKNNGNTNNILFSYNQSSTGTSGVTNSNPFIVGLRVNAASSVVNINGTDSTITLGGAGALSTRLYLGSDIAAGSLYTGYICELLLFNGLLSNANDVVVRNYLNNKWAVY